MNKSYFFSLAFATIALGCSDPVVDEPVAAPPPQPVDGPAISIVEPITTPAIAPSGVAVVTPATTPGDQMPETVATEQTLHTINMFLLEYQAGGGRIPATVEELVQQKIVPKLPSPPAGKRFEIDQQKAVISLADI
ncbi:MAG TPA: hypothetical protein VGH19_07290 [Verrucomicrobiae bacterium]